MNNYKASIKITLRKGILDVQGKAVENALHSMDFDALSEIRIGRFVELNVQADNADIAKTIAADACKKLIANPIIEDFDIVIEQA
jgi:phosphoribosylformylglycinamidine synthase